MNAPWWLPFGRVPEIAARELHAQLAGGVRLQLLDVRTGAEFSAGHVEGARNVPITSLQAAVAELDLDRSVRVVAICLSAHRSPPAVRLLRSHGHDAVQLRGGMLAWRLARLPEVKR